MSYDPSRENLKCPTCMPPKTGWMRPSKTSAKDGGTPDPYKWVYTALAFEAVAILGGVVYLAYLPIIDPRTITYVIGCPQCGQKLKFRRVSLGGLGACSRCKKPIRFPDEDDAVLESDLLRTEEKARERRLSRVADDDE